MSEPAPRVALYDDPVFEQHDTGGHPECADWLRAIRKRLAESGLDERTLTGVIRAADEEELGRIHPPRYQRLIRRFAAEGGGHLDPDTIVSPASADVAALAAGTACAAVDEVMRGTVHRALCLVRPPGHHALAERAMGFCLFNNVAVAAAHARAAYELERVLIVDWDVHHGNGTQDAFYEDANVYFLSIHRYPFYPGTGAADETGSGPGRGTTLNVPLRFGISRKEYRDAFVLALERIADRCRPELVLISAGFDAHARDPIGSLGLETEDFEALTRYVVDVARQHADNRLISMLEGGYDLPALAESVECHLRTLVEERV